MIAKLQNLLDEEIIWEKSADPERPFVGSFAGQKCAIRLNNFPVENLYTLIVNGKEVADFDDWPNQWIQAQQKSVAAD